MDVDIKGHAGPSNPLFRPTFDLSKVIPEPIDHRLAKKIAELVSIGVTDLGSLRCQLDVFVKEICQPPPHPANKRFFPVDKTIRNHVYEARHHQKTDDQTRIAAWVNDMNGSDDYIYCRLKSDSENSSYDNVQVGSKFLFVFQSAQQQRLLSRYGSMVLVDATYKTTMYDLPLFLLAVKTNVDFQVVGCFITEDETIASISEALTVMKQHCFKHNPAYFMTDFDESEMSAIEQVFPESKVLLCDFHREQSWERWTSRGDNSLGRKEEILKMLRRVAHARDVSSMNSAVEAVKASDCYTQSFLEKMGT